MRKPQLLTLGLILILFMSTSPKSVSITHTPMKTHSVAQIRDYWPTDGWLTSTPEENGMDSTFFDDLWQIAVQLRAFLVIRNGYIIYEEYRDAEYNETNLQPVFSVTKSFLSALVGMALEDGNSTSLDEFVVDYFPERTIANLNADKQSITIEHLLTMKSGFVMESDDMRASPDWVQYVLDLPLASTPGTTFYYTTGNSHLLSAIVNRSTGIPTMTFADSRLFQPLGITKYEWRTDPQGLAEGGSGLNLTARDVAKLGFLWLNNGSWDGEEIVSSTWVNASTHIHASDDDEYGYGYHWRIDPARNAYYAKGWRTIGQYMWVQPENDLIAVFTIFGSMSPLNLIRDYILPAIFSDGTTTTTLSPPSTTQTNVTTDPLPDFVPIFIGVGVAGVAVVAVLVIYFLKKR
jgi:CubicO group peptidase (beta-lactamase class C family)